MSEKLLQELKSLLEVVMEAQARVETVFKEYHKCLKEDYNALQDVMTMKESIHTLITSRLNIETKVREKSSQDEEEKIIQLLLKVEPEDFEEDYEDNYQEIYSEEEEEEIKEKLDAETKFEEGDNDPDWNPVEAEEILEETPENESGRKLEKRKRNMKQVDCPTCNRRMNSNQLKKHMLTHDAGYVKKTFTCRKSEKPQRKRVYTRVECPTCNRRMNINQLTRHMRIHNPKVSIPISPLITRTPITCTFCNKEFRMQCELSRHLKIHQEKTQVCDECGKAFHELNNLKQHKRVHQDERPFVCSECGADFKFSQSLRDHMIYKHAESGEQCSHCGILFSSIKTLRKHILCVHEKDSPRPYKCNICNKGFKQSSHLKYHLTTHSNPKSKNRGFNKERVNSLFTANGKRRLIRNKFHVNQSQSNTE